VEGTDTVAEGTDTADILVDNPMAEELPLEQDPEIDSFISFT